MKDDTASKRQGPQETWLETEAAVEDATGPGAHALLKSIGKTLGDAPESKRYDIQITVEERDVDA